ncbi:hypothetical protein EDB80DRAFT_778759 [Ilyonectria destructans]|nr:hypothetical protein EDB80DRAFT_778759 [Ilyonectria destructans]
MSSLQLHGGSSTSLVLLLQTQLTALNLRLQNIDGSLKEININERLESIEATIKQLDISIAATGGGGGSSVLNLNNPNRAANEQEITDKVTEIVNRRLKEIKEERRAARKQRAGKLKRQRFCCVVL